jgi:hypothetical protein
MSYQNKLAKIKKLEKVNKVNCLEKLRFTGLSLFYN